MSIPTHDDGSRGARALFEAQVDSLDGATATALRARRRDALAASRGPRRAVAWWPASGAVTAALALMLWLPGGDGFGTADDAGAGAPLATPTSGAAPASPSGVLGTGATASSATARYGDDGEGPGAAARFADGALAELENDAEFYTWLATAPEHLDLDPTPTAPPVQGPQEGLTP
jgi:hypothetical protein